MKNLFIKFISIFKKQQEHIPDYQFIVHHCRATDRVFFGPFKNHRELDAFFDDPKNAGIQCAIELLISPNVSKEQYWYNPNDYLREHHSYLFEREPINA